MLAVFLLSQDASFRTLLATFLQGEGLLVQRYERVFPFVQAVVLDRHAHWVLLDEMALAVQVLHLLRSDQQVFERHHFVVFTTTTTLTLGPLAPFLNLPNLTILLKPFDPVHLVAMLRTPHP